MKRFEVASIVAIVSFGLVQLPGSIPQTAQAQPGGGPAEWSLTLKALCHPVAACTASVCTNQGVGSCGNEVTPIPDVPNEECQGVPEWYKYCEFRSGNKTPCATITAVCRVVTLLDANNEPYPRCEAAASTSPPDPLIGTPAGNANECRDFSLF